MRDALILTSPYSRHHTTVLNADVRNRYTALKVVICSKFVMFGCIIAGSLCSIVSVLSCVAACCKISVADCQLLK